MKKVKTSSRRRYVVTARDCCLTLGEKTAIMGILNLTPDSFSQDGLLKKTGRDTVQHAIRQAQKFIRQGAEIIDIGGESSRPGAKRITVKEECQRVIPVIQRLKELIKAPISIDSYKPAVITAALDAGASIVNNIKGTQLSDGILRVVKKYDAAIVLMHMQGNPRIMQKKIHYRQLIADIKQSLENSIQICLDNGINSDKIIVDPGIGFGKTVEHNLGILNRLSDFQTLGCPLLIGTSRKSFIGKVLNTDVSTRLWGTAATVCTSILHGAHIIRVHDVKAMSQVARMTDAILNYKD